MKSLKHFVYRNNVLGMILQGKYSSNLSKKNGRKRKMSEEKYEDKILKILGMIAEQTKPKPPSIGSSEEHKHEPPKKAESAIDHIDVCPTCRNQFIEKLSPEIKAKTLKEIVEKAKGDYNCVGCGFKVERETETCPLCGKRTF